MNDQLLILFFYLWTNINIVIILKSRKWWIFISLESWSVAVLWCENVSIIRFHLYLEEPMYLVAQTEAKPGRSYDLWICRTTASHSPHTLSITTPSAPSQTYFTDHPLHLTLRLTARETFFLTKYCCRLIFKPSFLLLLISFTLFTFSSASCWTFLL